MNLPGINTKYIMPKEVFSLEISISHDGIMEYFLSRAYKDKIGFSLKEKLLFKDKEQLLSYLKEGIPVQLIVGGKGIFIKKIENCRNYDKKALLHQALPNSLPADFYLQLLTNPEGSCFLGIIRKSSINDILSSLKAKNIFITGFFISPFLLKPLRDFCKFDNEEFIINNYKIKFLGQELYEISISNGSSNEILVFESEEIETSYIPSFAASLLFYIQYKEIVTLEDDFFNQDFQQYLNKRWLKVIGTSGLFFFFVILLFNFLFLSHFEQKQRLLNNQYSLIAGKLEEAEYLEKEVKEKRLYLSKTGLDKTSKKSFYSDRIGSSLMDGINLTEMAIFPYHFKNNDQKKMYFEVNTIVIKGYCNQSVILNEWIKSLKQFDWVKDVKVISYAKDNTNSVATFELNVYVE